jgi:glutathione S-transferase
MKNDTSDLTLYEMEYCPFCQRVQYAMRELGLSLRVKDTLDDSKARQELIAGGGKSQVPCLRIDQPGGRVQWMYESSDIVDYLQERFGKVKPSRPLN